MEHFLEGIVLLTPISNKYASSLLSKLTNVFIEMFHYGCTCAKRRLSEGHGGDLSSQKLNDWAMWINSIY